MTAWYNEIDNYAADWLENLIAAGEIAPGIVDRRPIQEIEAYELTGFTQCHFFAGIGVWSGALRAAGWSDDRPIWTGSCPCQPFSNAGKQKGFLDERHLWPAWFGLIAQQKPDVIVGEQVDGAFEWIDLVSTNLEAENYAFGAGVICAAGFQGAHIRHRNYFAGLADTKHNDRRPNEPGRLKDRGTIDGGSGAIVRLADDDDARSQGYGKFGKFDVSFDRSIKGRHGSSNCVVGGLADDDEQQRNRSGDAGPRGWGEFTDSGKIIGLADADDARSLKRRIAAAPARQGNSPNSNGGDGGTNAPMLGRTPVDWLYCRDGKWRPVEPGTFPLVNETSARVGRLRAYGNALDFETAKNFCIAIREICDGV